LLGEDSQVDLREVPCDVTAQRVVVTKTEVLGKSLRALDLQGRYGVTLTRVARAGVEFTPNPNLRLHFGDELMAVGEVDAVEKVAEELGNSVKMLGHTQVIPVFVGIALGVTLGSWPVHLPGIPVPVKLGLAGGPLVVSILLSRVSHIGPLVWHMPSGANSAIRELGIVLFLACVGLKGGETFVATLTQGAGFQWMAWAAVITLLPIVTVALIARVFFKINYATLCGLLAGSMTDPPALAFAGAMTNSEYPSISYAAVYPLVMLLRVVAAQLIVLLFVH
jgi:putative transport protein